MSEYNEALCLVDILKLLKFPFWHIPQETYTPFWGQKMKNKAMGVSRGLPDYLIFIPEERSVLQKPCLVFIELKIPKKTLSRKSKRGNKGDSVSQNNATEEQRRFLDFVNQIPFIQGKVCFGCEDAVKFIKQFVV